MSKYQKLWEYIEMLDKEELTLSFEKAGSVLGFPVDHSFLSFKKELLPFGFEVGKISMKNKSISFIKTR